MYIGIDTIDVERMHSLGQRNWHRLRRIFTEHELATCYSNGAWQVHRLATRFAAKEAAFKALCQYTQPRPFFTICRYVWIEQGTPPQLHIDIHTELTTQVSLTHTSELASAVVLLYPA